MTEIELLKKRYDESQDHEDLCAWRAALCASDEHSWTHCSVGWRTPCDKCGRTGDKVDKWETWKECCWCKVKHDLKVTPTTT